jgi:hypothetical protein
VQLARARAPSLVVRSVCREVESGGATSLFGSNDSLSFDRAAYPRMMTIMMMMMMIISAWECKLAVYAGKSKAAVQLLCLVRLMTTFLAFKAETSSDCEA